MDVIVYARETGCAMVSPAPGFTIDDVIARTVPPTAARVTVDVSALPPGEPDTWQIVDGVLSSNASAAQAALQAYAAAVRYTKETGGITVSGHTVATDRGSQSLITGAAALLQADPAIETVNFKAESGFVVLARADFIALAQAVGAYVQACFTAESKVDADITSGVITTNTQIDAASYWPATTY